MGSLNNSGLRLRVAGAAGTYTYDKDFFFNGALYADTVRGNFLQGEALAGHAFFKPKFGATIFAGPTIVQTWLTPDDQENDDRGMQWDAALRANAYLKPLQRTIVSSQASVHVWSQRVSGRLAAAYTFTPWLSAGPEAMVFWANDYSEYRAGAEALFTITRLHKIGLSAGYSIDTDDNEGAYVGLHYKVR